MKESTPARIMTLRRLGLAEESASATEIDAVPMEPQSNAEHNAPAPAPAPAPLPPSPPAQDQSSFPDAHSQSRSAAQRTTAVSHAATQHQNTSQDVSDLPEDMTVSALSALLPQPKGPRFAGIQSGERRDDKSSSLTKIGLPYKHNLLQRRAGLTIVLGLTRTLLVINGGGAVTALLLFGIANTGSQILALRGLALLPSIDHFIIGVGAACVIAFLVYATQIIRLEFPSWPYLDKALRVSRYGAFALAMISVAEFGFGAVTITEGLRLAGLRDRVVSVTVPIPSVSETKDTSTR